MANITNQILVSLAEKLFVYESKSCAEIAKKIGKNRRTVETWKNKFGWEEKRAELIESQRALPQKLYGWYNLIMEGIAKDLKKGEKISASQWRVAAQLFEQIPKADAVEKAGTAKTEEKKIDKSEIINAVRQAVGLEDSETEAEEDDAV